jgi:hypothetical protein
MDEDEVVDVLTLISQQVCKVGCLVLFIMEVVNWPDLVGTVQEKAVVPTLGNPLEHCPHRGVPEMALFDLNTEDGPIPLYCVLGAPQHGTFMSLDIDLNQNDVLELVPIQLVELDFNRGLATTARA